MSERLTEWNAMVQTKGWGGRRNHCISLFERQTKPQKAHLHFLCYFGIFSQTLGRMWKSPTILLGFHSSFLRLWHYMEKAQMQIIYTLWSGRFSILNLQTYIDYLENQYWFFFLFFFPKHMEIATCTSILYSSHEVNTTIKTSVSFSYITILWHCKTVV